jgi:hypothetical protein
MNTFSKASRWQRSTNSGRNPCAGSKRRSGRAAETRSSWRYRRKDSQNGKTGNAQVAELIDLTMRVAQKVARVGTASSIPLHGLRKLLRENSALARSPRTSPRQVMRCIGAACTATHACCAQPCLLHRKQIHNATDCGQVRMANISGRGRKRRSSLVGGGCHPFG